MIDMYEDQFEEFKARAKRGSIDSYLLKLPKARQEILRAKNMDNSLDTQTSVSAPNSRESTPTGFTRSGPPSRTCSLKKKKRPVDLTLDFDQIRPRTSSMPSTHSRFRRSDYLSPPKSNLARKSGDEDHCPLYRVRSFKTTSKGIVNRGDSFKSRSTNSVASTSSLNSCGGLSRPNSYDDIRNASSANSNCSISSSTGSSAYRVIMLGASGVGKTALIKQFMTSEYMAPLDSSIVSPEPTDTPATPRYEEEMEKTVSVLLDGEESEMDFVDSPSGGDYRDQGEADAYVIVFSETDRKSFTTAVELLFSIRKKTSREVALILVGNKTDLVRSKQITLDEAKEIAVSCNCKFIETSAALNHQVDDLLVGILSQIRLAPKREELKRKKKQSKENNCVNRAAKGLISKLFRKESFSKSCDNLLVL